MRHQQIVEDRDLRSLDGGGGGVEGHREQPLAARVDEVPGLDVASEETAFDEPADLAGGHVEHADA